MQSSQQPSSSRHIYTITANQTSVQMVMIMHHNLYQRDTNFLCLFKTTHHLRPYRIVFSGLVCGLDEAPRAPPLLTLPRLLVSLPVQHHGYFSRLKFASHICPSHIRNPTFASDEVNRLYIYILPPFCAFVSFCRLQKQPREQVEDASANRDAINMLKDSSATLISSLSLF